MLRPNGTCVTFGVSETSTVSVESRDFFAVGGTRLYGLTLFHELMSVERAGIGLGLLTDLITAKKLRPQIAVEAPWGEIGGRSTAGRARLHRQGSIAHLRGGAVAARQRERQLPPAHKIVR
jgi:hypothetical protein